MSRDPPALQELEKRTESAQEVRAALKEARRASQLLEPVARRRTAAEAASVRTGQSILPRSSSTTVPETCCRLLDAVYAMDNAHGRHQTRVVTPRNWMRILRALIYYFTNRHEATPVHPVRIAQQQLQLPVAGSEAIANTFCPFRTTPLVGTSPVSRDPASPFLSAGRLGHRCSSIWQAGGRRGAPGRYLQRTDGHRRQPSGGRRGQRLCCGAQWRAGTSERGRRRCGLARRVRTAAICCCAVHMM